MASASLAHLSWFNLSCLTSSEWGLAQYSYLAWRTTLGWLPAVFLKWLASSMDHAIPETHS